MAWCTSCRRVEATVEPVVLLFMNVAIPGHPSPIPLKPSGIRYCDRCKRDAREASDVMDEAAWRWVDAVFDRLADGERPIRRHTRLTFDSI